VLGGRIGLALQRVIDSADFRLGLQPQPRLVVLRKLLTEALSNEAATPIRKEARHEPDRG